MFIHEFIQTILKISLKAKSINEIKYNGIITFLDAYVNNIQNYCDRFKERNGPSNIFMMINNKNYYRSMNRPFKLLHN